MSCRRSVCRRSTASSARVIRFADDDSLLTTTTLVFVSPNFRHRRPVVLFGSADLERTNKKGFTPLQLAVRSGHLGVAEEVLRRGARSDVITKAGLCLRCLANSTDHGYLAVSRTNETFSTPLPYRRGICASRLVEFWQPLTSLDEDMAMAKV